MAAVGQALETLAAAAAVRRASAYPWAFVFDAPWAPPPSLRNRWW